MQNSCFRLNIEDFPVTMMTLSSCRDPPSQTVSHKKFLLDVTLIVRDAPKDHGAAITVAFDGPFSKPLESMNNSHVQMYKHTTQVKKCWNFPLREKNIEYHRICQNVEEHLSI